MTRPTSLLIMNRCPLSVGLRRDYFYFTSNRIKLRQSPRVVILEGLIWGHAGGAHRRL